jgi:hypothetical protein
MFKKSIATLAVIAGVLGAAGPASASTKVSGVVAAPHFKSFPGLDSETEFMDYTDDVMIG